MALQNLSGWLGDGNILRLNMERLDMPGVPFDATGYGLIFTAKYDDNDLDSAAVFQKYYPDGGITVSGGVATIEMVHSDSSTLCRCSLTCDIQAQDVNGGSPFTVAKARLDLARDTTRELTTSVPVYLAQPGPVGIVLPPDPEDGQVLGWQDGQLAWLDATTSPSEDNPVLSEDGNPALSEDGNTQLSEG